MLLNFHNSQKTVTSAKNLISPALNASIIKLGTITVGPNYFSKDYL